MAGPWLGDNRRDFHAKFHIGGAGGLANLACEDGEPRGLRRPVGSAQQRRSAALEVLGRGVMAKVRREVHVNSSGASRLERAIPRAAQNGYALHRGSLVATSKETGGSRRQDGCHVVCEGAERDLIDGADASQADLVSLGVGATRLQRRGIAQADQIGVATPSQATSALVCALNSAIPERIRVVTTLPFGSVTGRKEAPRRSSGWWVITMS